LVTVESHDHPQLNLVCKLLNHCFENKVLETVEFNDYPQLNLL